MPTAEVFSERDRENAEIVGLLLMTAKTLQHLNPGKGHVDGREMDWIASLLRHALSRYGDGKKLEADTFALARTLGMSVEQIIVHDDPGKPALVH